MFCYNEMHTEFIKHQLFQSLYFFRLHVLVVSILFQTHFESEKRLNSVVVRMHFWFVSLPKYVIFLVSEIPLSSNFYPPLQRKHYPASRAFLFGKSFSMYEVVFVFDIMRSWLMRNTRDANDFVHALKGLARKKRSVSRVRKH